MILVTGSAGFIGYHLSKHLLERGDSVIGLDNINDYYDVQLKQDRLKQVEEHPNFTFHKLDLCDREGMEDLFAKNKITRICHLAAQVGVRYSLENPYQYQKSNLEGFLNIIELARQHEVKNFIYASSSSVYGGNKKVPFSTNDRTDEPLSFYGATKKSNELTASAYHHIYGLPVTGLRFFTVYGPWGRPDMAPFIFTRKIINGETINVFGHGKMKRSFTYIDDIIQGIVLCLDKPQPCALYNIGNDRTEELEAFIRTIEGITGEKAVKKYCDKHSVEMTETSADIEPIKNDLGYCPTTNIDSGMKQFVDWYRKYFSK